jgi:hypothetical protein
MALGNSGSNTGILYILKVVDKDKDKKKVDPHFTITKKVDGKWTLQPETVNRVSGNLSKIEIKEQEYKGDKYNTVSLYLRDGEESYLIDLRFNLPSRSLFNSFASLESYDNLSVTVYANKTGYTALGLWQGDKMVKWKYKLDELPAPDAVTFKGKEMHDYTKVDEFFVKVLQEIAGKLGGSQKRVSENPASEAAPAAAAGDEDVPF